MIFLSDTYSNRPVLSLRTGSSIGYIYAPIISPHNLKIEGWYASAHGEKGTMVLPVSELRDIIAKGLVVNDHDAITPIDDIIRLKEVIESEFDPIGMPVETESGQKLGKVKDYAVDNMSFYIKKLYVSQSLLRSLTSFTRPQLIIDRSQVIDVTNEKIVVREATEKVPNPGHAAARA